MGTWGTGLYSDDTTCDVRDRYLLNLKAGLSSDDSCQDILDRHGDLLRNTETACLVYFALADTAWRYGRLNEAVKDRALSLLKSGGDIAVWERASARRSQPQRQSIFRSRNPRKSAPPLPSVRSFYWRCPAKASHFSFWWDSWSLKRALIRFFRSWIGESLRRRNCLPKSRVTTKHWCFRSRFTGRSSMLRSFPRTREGASCQGWSGWMYPPCLLCPTRGRVRCGCPSVVWQTRSMPTWHCYCPLNSQSPPPRTGQGRQRHAKQKNGPTAEADGPWG